MKLVLSVSNVQSFLYQLEIMIEHFEREGCLGMQDAIETVVLT